MCTCIATSGAATSTGGAGLGSGGQEHTNITRYRRYHNARAEHFSILHSLSLPQVCCIMCLWTMMELFKAFIERWQTIPMTSPC